MHLKLTTIDLAKHDILKYLQASRQIRLVSCGPDEISTTIIKEVAIELAMPFPIIFMKSRVGRARVKLPLIS